MTTHHSIVSVGSHKPIAGFTRYRIFDHGLIEFRYQPSPKRPPVWKPLKPAILMGRPVMRLNEGGRRRVTFMGRLVLETFIGPCPPGMECCHKDDDPFNNRVENLRWDTRLANMADRWARGVTNAGSRNGMSKLCEQDIREIRQLLAMGFRQVAVAELFDMNPAHVSMIHTGRLWAHVT